MPDAPASGPISKAETSSSVPARPRRTNSPAGSPRQSRTGSVIEPRWCCGSAGELGETIRNNPFLHAGASENFLHVMFLESQPDASAIAALDPDRSPPDAFVVRGREIYLQCPNGAGSTKLTNAWFDSRLSTISTGRNWRTVLKLFELATLLSLIARCDRLAALTTDRLGAKT